VLLNIAGGRSLGLLEVNEAAEIIHGVAHPDANIIFGSVIDDSLGDSVRVTVIAAGFDQYETRTDGRVTRPNAAQANRDNPTEQVDVFKLDENDLDIDDDDGFDVPSFLR
jgi:cell division protein FtsZ